MIVQLFLAASVAVLVYAVFMLWLGRGRPRIGLMCCQIALGIFALGGAIFAIGGRLEPAVAALFAAAVLALLAWLQPIVVPADEIAKPAPFWIDAALIARSRHLRVTLDIATGGLRAEVRVGRHTGRMLADLGRAEAMEVLSDLAAAGDVTALAVVEAWLDRHDPGWRREARGRHYADLAEPVRTP